MMHKLEEAAAFLRKRGFDKCSTGIVLGTGLGRFLDHLEIIERISYKQIPHFPVATMEFHAGNLILGKLGKQYVLAMQGRFHFYEGYSMSEITFPIRVMKLLGIRCLLLSNAAGGINLNFKKGSLVVIEDHINLQSQNPLTGPNQEVLGPRFPDMSMPYDPKLRSLFHREAKKLGVESHEGVYVSVNGPNLETRAEYRFLKTIGADVVGMSTVPEVIVANHMKMPCMAVSVVTDECDPDNLQAVNLDDIIAVAGTADQKLSAIFAGMIREMAEG